MFLSPLGIIFLIDFVFTLNHLSVEMSRNIYWNKKEKHLRIKTKKHTLEIDSANVIKVVSWSPRFLGFGKLAPGESLGKHQFFTEYGCVEISDMIMSNYLDILPQLSDNLIVKKKQFNIIEKGCSL